MSYLKAVISTCKQKGRNFRDFLVDYVREYNKGNRDFVDLVRLALSPVRAYNKLNFDKVAIASALIMLAI